MPVLAPGSLYIQNDATGAFDRFYVSTGVVTPGVPLSCGTVSASATMADGTAVGSQSNGNIVKFDPVSGVCQTLFTAPEWIDALAVSPNGTFVGQSHGAGGAVRAIYRLTINGAVVSKVDLVGVAALGGIAYSLQNKLYATAFAAPGDGRWYSLFADTGTVVTVASGNQLAASGVCIDSNGVAYGHVGSSVYAYNAATGAGFGAVDFGRHLGSGAIVCR